MFNLRAEWFSNEKSVELLSRYLAQKNSIRLLGLDDNNFDGGALAQILGAIRSNGQAFYILEFIDIDGAKWDTDQACLELAELLAHAH